MITPSELTIQRKLKKLRDLNERIGPHFRYEEDSLYPKMRKCLGDERVNEMLNAHDGAVEGAKRLLEITGDENISEDEAEEGAEITRAMMTHVQDCDGLGVLREKLDERGLKQEFDTLEEYKEEAIPLWNGRKPSGSQMKETQRRAIIIHSSGFDRVSYALDIANVALFTGTDMETLFTWGGLNRLVKGQMDEPKASEEELQEHIKWGLERGGMESLFSRYENARKLGLNIYACSGAMSVLAISRDDLIDDIDGVTGLATFISKSIDADLSFYI